MKKKYLFVKGACQWNKLVHKFLNLRKRIAGQMKNGEFQILSCDEQNRLHEKLRKLLIRLENLQHKVGVNLAAGALLFTLSTGTAAAQTFVPDSVLQTTAISQDQIKGLTFADIDNDGDLDLFIGQYNGYGEGGNNTILYYKNNGTSSVSDFALQGNLQDSSYTDIQVGKLPTPTFADIDGDGDLDLLIGQNQNYYPYYGNTIKYYRNNGTASVMDFADQGNLQDSSGSDIICGYSESKLDPVLADLDQDGDLDLFIGNYYGGGRIKYYENIGDSLSFDFVDQNNLQDSTYADISSGYLAPISSFVDIDNDGDLDLLVREGPYGEGGGGNISYYKNYPGVNPFNLVLADTLQYDNQGTPEDINESENSIPAFVDIDNDGDFDLLIKPDFQPHIRYYENTGTSSAHNFIRGQFLDGGLHTINLDNATPPSLFDIDSDGDLDLFYATYQNIFYYKNTGTELSAVFEPQNFLKDSTGQIISQYSLNPTFADIDGDNDLDLFIGTPGGKVQYYKNTGDSSGFESVSQGFLQDTSGVDIVLQGYSPTIPAFTDIDNDGDLDLFIGEYDGTIRYYQNIGDANSYGFAFQGNLQDNSPADISTGSFSYAAPAFADADHDGDQDLFLGNNMGAVFYCQNTGNASAFSFTPLDSLKDNTGTPINAGNISKPGLGDLDHDGDYDLFIGNNSGSINHYINETPGVWKGAADTDWSNPVNWQDNILPVSTVNVFIPDEAINICNIGSNTVNAQNVLIESSAELASGSGTLTISNNLINYGTFSAGTGIVIFDSVSTVTGTVAFNNVEVNWDVDFGTSSTVNGILTLTPAGIITTNAPLVISRTDQPIYCSGGGAAVISSQVTGGGVGGYQWLESSDSGATFDSLFNAGIYSNVDSSYLNISDVSALNAYQYKCIIWSEITFETFPATIYTVDSIPPVAIAQDISVFLDGTGNASIVGADVDNGSTDNCSIANLAVVPDPYPFTCSDIGPNIVTLVVTDNTSNTDTVTAIVTVADTTSPVAVCQDITVYLDAAGNASITAVDVDGGSNDACGIDSLYIDIMNFTCVNTGNNIVTLTVTDNNGNTANYAATVTIQDTMAPVVTCPGNIVVCEDSSTVNYTYPTATDICGVDTITQITGLTSGSVFPVGITTNIFVAEDLSGNTDTCSFTVTVNPVYSIIDAPVSICDGSSIMIYGISRSVAGTYYDSLLTTGLNCDSVHSTVLTIDPTYDIVDAPLSICDGSSTMIYGISRSTAGTYYDSLLTTGTGCDSVHSTVLTLDPAYDIVDAPESVCDGDSTSIYGTWRKTAGTYYDNYTTAGPGCDSIYSTVLTINPTYDIVEAPISICDGDSSLIYGTYYNVPGTYYDSLTSVDGCDSVRSTVLIVNPLPVVDLGADTTICNGCSLTLDAGSGFTSYSWSTGDTTQTITVNTTDTYSVTVIDNNGCSANDMVMVTVSAAGPLANVSGIDVNCNGICDGEAIVTVTGGTVPYTYLWDDPASQTTATAGNLCAGNYSVIVTDLASLTDTAYITINEPVALATVIAGTDISTCGADDGSATLTPSGGTLPFTYIWSNGYTTQNLSGLPGGTYSVTVTDANGCNAYNNIYIIDPPAITTGITGTDVSSCGAGDGAIDLTVTGGVSPYAFIWSNGDTTEDLSNLTKGTYSVTIIDVNGCTTNETWTINEPPVFSTTITGTDVTCSGGDDASADLTISGGVAPFTFSWSNGAATEDVSGLSAGTYTVTVTDANGCSSAGTITIYELPPLTATTFALNVSTCGGSDATATATVSGGTAPYEYVWSNGDTLSTASALPSGIHYVTVTDANGCIAYGTVTVNESGGPVITGSSIVNVTCSGYANGSIDIGVSGGTLPYSYLWSNGSATEDISNLTGGTYEVVITDFSGCIASASFTVTKPDPLSASLSIVNASCNGADGSAVINVSGGTTPYTYMWSTFGTNSSQMGLSAGVYSVTVIDANVCVSVTPVVINSLGGPSITVNSVTNVNCDYPDNGSIDISVNGGSMPYTYQWSNSDTTEDLSDLTDATYNVTVTGANGCVAAASIDILYMPPLDVKICIITVDSATGKNLIVWEKEPGLSIDSYNIYKEGTQANVYFRIGTVPYDSLSIFVDLQANPAQRSWRYKLTAGDTCISESESEMSPLHKSIHLTVNLGLNGEINLIWDHYVGFPFGTYYIYRGSSPNDMDSLDALPSNLNSYTDFSPPSGQLYYQVAAVHPTGCTATLKTKDYNSSKSNTSSIASAGTLTATAIATDATYGNCDGSATVTASGGTTPYTYLWDDPANQVTSTATGLCGNTTYTALVTDAYDDTFSSNVFVGEASGINQQSAISNQQLIVYPNPGSGVFTLKIIDSHPPAGGYDCIIYDVLGQEIYRSEITNTQSEIDMSAYPTGIYNLLITTEESVGNIRVIIE
ncbi:MAG: FG-GAP-like repeat-containing protein [Bacteroidota bacterium]